MSVIELWVYLSTSPLLWLTATLGAYVIADRLSQKLNRNPLANPVLIAVLLLMALLKISDTPFPVYFEGAQFVHFMLGPATVALAIPLVENLAEVKRNLVPMLAALAVGSATAVSSAVAIAWALGADNTLIASIAPKSVTAPVAMGISERLGGLPSLTAALVILTGITGAMLGPLALNLIGVRDWRARGLAIGTASHGIGTARALQVNEVAGAFAGLAMGLNALATAILLPIVWRLFF